MPDNPRPARVNPPGNLVARELEARGWSQKDLADIMGRPVQAINEIIRGTKQITAATAIELAGAFETTPEIWLNLETKYRLFMAEKSNKNSAITQKSRLYSKVPVAEIIRRKWIPAEKNLTQLEKEVCRFLGINSIDDEPDLILSMRHSRDKQPHDTALTAWMARARNLAVSQSLTAGFRRSEIPALVKDLSLMMRFPEDVTKVKAALQAHGIRFVLVPHLPKTYLDGAAFFLDPKTEAQPVVALTMRYDRIDWFWFTLLHELAHLYKNHCTKNGFVLDGENIADNNSGFEDEANGAAGEWLIPTSEYARCREKFFSGTADIKAVALRVGRHPGIVLGRLQRDGIIPYSRHRSLLVRIKQHLDAMIDRP